MAILCVCPPFWERGGRGDMKLTSKIGFLKKGGGIEKALKLGQANC